MPTHTVESNHVSFWVGAVIVFVLMVLAGAVIHGGLRDRGFGTLGNGFFLFIGLVIGVFVMRGIQGLMA